MLFVAMLSSGRKLIKKEYWSLPLDEGWRWGISEVCLFWTWAKALHYLRSNIVREKPSFSPIMKNNTVYLILIWILNFPVLSCHIQLMIQSSLDWMFLWQSMKDPISASIWNNIVQVLIMNSMKQRELITSWISH